MRLFWNFRCLRPWAELRHTWWNTQIKITKHPSSWHNLFVAAMLSLEDITHAYLCNNYTEHTQLYNFTRGTGQRFTISSNICKTHIITWIRLYGKKFMFGMKFGWLIDFQKKLWQTDFFSFRSSCNLFLTSFSFVKYTTFNMYSINVSTLVAFHCIFQAAVERI